AALPCSSTTIAQLPAHRLDFGYGRPQLRRIPRTSAAADDAAAAGAPAGQFPAAVVGVHRRAGGAGVRLPVGEELGADHPVAVLAVVVADLAADVGDPQPPF